MRYGCPCQFDRPDEIGIHKVPNRIDLEFFRRPSGYNLQISRISNNIRDDNSCERSDRSIFKLNPDRIQLPYQNTLRNVRLMRAAPVNACSPALSGATP